MLRILACTLLFLLPALAQGSGKQLYESACAACHGVDGKGLSQEKTGLSVELPDFSDCEFASREPDGDWHAVIHEGGPVRGFDPMMPAFGGALTDTEIYAILGHVRTFCVDDRWPRGEFNLPRPLFTEKAFVEDELVVTARVDTGSAGYATEFLYEKRFGPQSMIEFAATALQVEDELGETSSGVGDFSIGFKHTLYHNLDTGNVFSIGIETIFPTGDEDKGLGAGSTIIEPFLAYARLLPADSFLQAHTFAELPTDGSVNDEVGLGLALGRTWVTGEFGRAWTPIVEVLATRELGSGQSTDIDVAPQLQVSLNQRQHVLLNVGLRVPVSNTSGRDAEINVYVLWDWFDGGFADGW